jgi:catechol 2,3-dioxygenase-like lactoylglutathione lyase family enzyme
MLKLDHVVFPVRDAERTLEFYRETLGLPLLAAHTGDDWDGHRWLMMIFGLAKGQEIVCVALDGAPAPDYRGLPIDVRHYALSCGGPEELDEWRERLSDAGVEYWEERHGEGLSIYFPDPDGVILEITWPPSAERKMENPMSITAVKLWAARAKAPA